MINIDLMKNQSNEMSKFVQTDLDEATEIPISSELILPSIKNTISHHDDTIGNYEEDHSISSPKM